MKVELEPGKYIVAVSGGVDSVVLLDILRNLPGMELAVAHFDHGIRSDSGDDRVFVQSLAKKYGLSFEYAKGQLGPDASEATARTARYDFLGKIMKKYQARAIVTAHHEDDALETAIINLLRGTGRKGLSALASTRKLERPLLHVSKTDVIKYAKAHGLRWREDSTNQKEIYLRNYIRQQLLPRFGEQHRRQLLGLIKQSKATNQKLDSLLEEELRRHAMDKQLDRRWFNSLPHAVALEVMATWLRRQDIRDFGRTTLERLVVAAKTGQAGQRFDVVGGATMKAGKNYLALEVIER